MIRKQILPSASVSPRGRRERGTLDVAAIASVLLTSECSEHPIENAFDANDGPGGTRWIAGEPGEQTVTLAFDSPQTIREVAVQCEERELSRTQVLKLSISQDGGQSYRELLRQEYNFSPQGATFEEETWAISVEGVTHLQVHFQPDKGHVPVRATLTSLVLR